MATTTHKHHHKHHDHDDETKQSVPVPVPSSSSSSSKKEVVESKGGSNNNKVLLHKFIALYRTLSGCSSSSPPNEDRLQALFNHITATEAGRAWLQNLLAPYEPDKPIVGLPTTSIERKNVYAFKQSVGADADFQGALVYLGVTITSKGTPIRHGNGHIGGVFGIVGSISHGTLYYDDEADLQGDWDIEVNIATAYVNVNFIRKGKTFATYQGAGSSNLVGIGGGRFSFGGND